MTSRLNLRFLLVAVLGLVLAAVVQAGQASRPGAAPAGPVVVMETAKGTIEFETFPEDAPKTVEQVLTLVKKNFYRGLRFHRVEKNFVIQVGDPRTRDVTRMDQWGKGGSAGGSGKPIGVAEFSKKRLHKRGAVGIAYASDPKEADSQFYIMLANRPALDGKYAVFGQVIAGMDVVEKIEVGDVIKKISVKEATAK